MNTLAILELLAADPAPKSGGGYQMLIMMGLLLVVMWVVMIRPQQKRQKELQQKIEALKKGDKVVTIGGLHGMVNHISEKTVSLKVADGQFLTFDKKAIATTISKKSDGETEEKK